MKKKLLFLFLIFAGIARAQQTNEDSTLEMNDSLYNSLESGNLLFGGDGLISKSYSLRAYCPLLRMPVLGGLGWTSAISKAMALQLGIMRRWTREKIEKEIFSPYFLHDMLPKTSVVSCKLRRDWPRETQQLLLRTGNIKNSDYPHSAPDCHRSPSSEQMRLAEPYQVRSFTKLFNVDQTNNSASIGQKQFMIKRSLLRNHPVVLCIMADRGFPKLDKETWIPDFSVNTGVFQALVVVGYDDQRQAFEISGLSGKEWGKDGFAWIRYSDLIFARYGFEMVFKDHDWSAESIKPQKVKPSKRMQKEGAEGRPGKPVTSKKYRQTETENMGLSGSLLVNTVNDQGSFVPVQVRRDADGFYQALGDYKIFSQFQIVGTDAQRGSYIYVLGIDPTGRAALHYPYGLAQANGVIDRHSPMVMDANTEFVIPQPAVSYDSDGNQTRKDQVFIKEYTGTDWLITLFCDHRIDPEVLSLVQNLSGHHTDFLYQFKKVFGSYLVAADQIKLQPQKIEFKTSPGDRSRVTAIILKIEAN